MDWFCLFVFSFFKKTGLQNGTLEEVKKIVSMLNEAEVPSENVVGKLFIS